MRGELIENYYILNMNRALVPPTSFLPIRPIPHHTKNFHCFFMDAARMFIRLWIFIKSSVPGRKSQAVGEKYLSPETRQNPTFLTMLFWLKTRKFFSLINNIARVCLFNIPTMARERINIQPGSGGLEAIQRNIDESEDDEETIKIH